MSKKLMLSIFLISFVFFVQSRLTFCDEITTNLNQPPKLSFKTPSNDFGETFRGENVEHIYKFKINQSRSG